MNYTENNKKELLGLISKNINFYRYHANNMTIMNEKGFVTIESLAEAINSSPNMLYNLSAKNVTQGVSIVFVDKIARALDVALYCFFAKETTLVPPRYENINVAL